MQKRTKMLKCSKKKLILIIFLPIFMGRRLAENENCHNEWRPKTEKKTESGPELGPRGGPI